MAGRIPEIVYRKLASQQTGTLGVDLSAGQATRSIANSIAEPIAEREKKEAKLKNAEGTSNAIRGTTNYTNSVANYRDFDDFDSWYESASTQLDAQSEGISDPVEQKKFNNLAAQRLDGLSFKARGFYEKKAINTGIATVEERAVQAENDAFNAGREFAEQEDDELGIAEGTLNDILSGKGAFALPSIIAPASQDVTTIGDAYELDENITAAKSKEVASRATKKFLQGIVDSENPDRVHEVIDVLDNSGYSEELNLSREEIQGFKSDAVKLQKIQNQKRVNEFKTLRNERVQEVYSRLLGDPRDVTMTEWEALRFRPDPLITQEQYNAGKKKILAAPEKGFPENSAASIDDILADFHNSFEKVKKGEIPDIEDVDEMTLEEIAHLQAVVMDSNAANKIDKDVAQTWLNELDPKLDLGLAQILDRFNRNAEWLEPKGGSEEDWVKSRIWKTDAEAKNALGQFKTDMLQNIQKAEEIVDRTLTPGELDDVLEASTQEFASRYNPARKEFSLGDKRYDPVSKQELMIEAWDEFGYPIWTNDLSTQIRQPKERSELIEQVMSGR